MFKVLTQCICFAFIRHGYARWQYISDDRENGLFEAARQELNLPSANEIIGAQSNNEANVSMCSLCPFLQISKWCGPIAFLISSIPFPGEFGRCTGRPGELNKHVPLQGDPEKDSWVLEKEIPPSGESLEFGICCGTVLGFFPEQTCTQSSHGSAQ